MQMNLYALRVYVQKTSKGERTITIELNGEASYHQNALAEGVFGQPFGQLDRAPLRFCVCTLLSS